MRVAIVHDWLTGMRGGERVLEQLIALFPDSEIFTLLHTPGAVSRRIESRPIRSSFVQYLPFARSRYRYYLPLFPSAIERFDVSGFDLVISSSHCVAKGVRTARTPHLSYCHTPMRYIWDRYDEYFGPGRASPLVNTAASLISGRLQEWDVRTAASVDMFVANSHHVKERIRHCYRRSAQVVYPPVAIDRFSPQPRQDHYICLGAFVPYKRFDLAIRAFNALGAPLIMVGDGPDYRKLRRIARPNITFTGRLPDDEVAALLGSARAMVMPMVEDFGISAVEAQAAGTPVIAYAAGGALETVVPYPARTRRASADSLWARSATGLLFEEQTDEAIVDAVRLRERLEFDIAILQANAGRFDTHAFRDGINTAVSALLGMTAQLDPQPAR